MSFARKRLLLDMVRDAGLEVISTDIKNNRVSVEVEAPNGVKGTFQVSTSAKIDPRGDMNEHARIKRFARQNPAPGAAPQPEEETMSKKEATHVTPAAQQLTPGEFYKLCVWIKDECFSETPESLEVFAALASASLKLTVSADTMREAMTATDTPEPEVWTALPDPHVLLARELAAIQAALGQEPSPSFRRFLGTLA